LAALFPVPVFQFADSSGRPYAGGSLTFSATGTSTPRDTYSDASLSTPNTNPVVLNSAGWPAVDIYLQNLPYRVVLRDSAGNAIWTRDNVRGSDFASVPMWTSVSGNPNGQLAGTASSSGVLPSMAWDRTNAIMYVCTTSGTSSTAVWTAVNPATGQLVWTIADRVSAAPSAADAGTSYIVSSGFGGFTTGTIITDNGLGEFTATVPTTDCGWIAYVQDEDRYYSFQSTDWVLNGLLPAAGDAEAGKIETAVQSEMEAASSATVAVTPGRQHFHPGHPKAGGNFDGTGTPAFRSGDYGMGALDDNGTGDYTPHLDTAFNDTNFWCSAWGRRTSAGVTIVSGLSGDAKTASSFQVRTTDGAASGVDAPEVGITFWGDYA
jgi:hypothetical protein